MLEKAQRAFLDDPVTDDEKRELVMGLSVSRYVGEYCITITNDDARKLDADS